MPEIKRCLSRSPFIFRIQNMKCYSILLSFAALVFSIPAFAQLDIGEGYVRPTYRELVQTAVMLDAFDIKTPQVTDEYARLMYCNLYKKEYVNDVGWSKIRQKIVSRAAEKKEYYRVLYETTGIFELERYNFTTQSFPLSKKTTLKNVGSILLITTLDVKPYCNIEEFFFPTTISLQLNRPLTIDRLPLPPAEVESLLARIEETQDKRRLIYGRIRVRITDAPVASSRDTRMFLNGDVRHVDFFIDPEMTKPIGGVQVRR
jgi:hypothetical protein